MYSKNSNQSTATKYKVQKSLIIANMIPPIKVANFGFYLLFSCLPSVVRVFGHGGLPCSRTRFSWVQSWMSSTLSLTRRWKMDLPEDTSTSSTGISWRRTGFRVKLLFLKPSNYGSILSLVWLGSTAMIRKRRLRPSNCPFRILNSSLGILKWLICRTTANKITLKSKMVGFSFFGHCCLSSTHSRFVSSLQFWDKVTAKQVIKAKAKTRHSYHRALYDVHEFYYEYILWVIALA